LSKEEVLSLVQKKAGDSGVTLGEKCRETYLGTYCGPDGKVRRSDCLKSFEGQWIERCVTEFVKNGSFLRFKVVGK
jgi:hypothetical protein